MKVVLDTNVIVSGLLTTHGVCGQILDLLTEGVFQVCVNDRILDEYEAVVPRPELDIDPAAADDILDLVRATGEQVAATPLPVVLPHEDDRPFLEVAGTAHAVLVTGNKRHYPKRARGDLAVVDCREFLELLRGSL